MKRRFFFKCSGASAILTLINANICEANLSGSQMEVSSTLTNVRSLERWKTPTFIHHGVSKFAVSDRTAKGIHTIIEGQRNDLPIDILLNVKPEAPLVIFLNGAQDRKGSLKLPAFVGLGVTPSSDVSRLSINDPGLYLGPELTLAWYAGAKELALQKLLPQIIDKVIDFAKPSRVMFVGGSAGGFASLYYSRFVPGSLAVVWNPQTNLLKYYSSRVTEYARLAFGLQDFEAVKNDLPNLIDCDLTAASCKNKSDNFIIYLQNSQDWHVKTHCQPYFSSLGYKILPEINSVQLDRRIYFHMDNWGPGHKMPPKLFIGSLLASLLGEKGQWQELFENHKIRSMMVAATENSVVARTD